MGQEAGQGQGRVIRNKHREGQRRRGNTQMGGRHAGGKAGGKAGGQAGGRAGGGAHLRLSSMAGTSRGMWGRSRSGPAAAASLQVVSRARPTT